MAQDMRRLIVRVDEQDADAEAVEELTTGLRGELRALDAEAERLGGGEAPPGSRAIEWVAVGTLVVTLAQSDVLAAIINAVSQWAGRNLRRTVRIELDGDVLEMTGHGSAEQKRLTEAWLAGKQAPKAAAAGNRHALIVAGYEFQDPGLRRLRAPAHDAEALSKVLRNPAIGDFTVQTLLNEPAPVINEAIEEFFSDRKPDDLLLVHFSGHGVKDEEGELYFATAATKLNRLGATAVSADFVNKRMNRSRSRRIVLLLDCCYAGAFGRGMVPRAGKQMDIQGHFGGRGRAVITASNASEYAFEGADLADSDPTPSVFTSALVDGLRTGDADMDQDGFVGLDELYEYVYDQVRRTTPNQTPGKWTFDLQGDLRIAKRGKPVTKPAALPQEIQAALEHPLAGVRAGAVTELVRLLSAKHGGVALAARLALEQLSDDDSREVSSRASAVLAAAAPTAPPVAAPPVAAPPVTVAPEPVPVAVATPVAMTTPAIVEPIPAPPVAVPQVAASPVASSDAASPVASPDAASPVAVESVAGAVAPPVIADPVVPRQTGAPKAPAPEPARAKPIKPTEPAGEGWTTGPAGRLKWNAAAILTWTAAVLVLLEMAQGWIFQPIPFFSVPYMGERGPGLTLFFTWLLLPALLVFATGATRRIRLVAQGAVVGTAAGVLGMLYVNSVIGGSRWSAQFALLAVASLVALAAVAVDLLGAVSRGWQRIVAVVAVVAAAVPLVVCVYPHESRSSVPDPTQQPSMVIAGLAVLYLVILGLRWQAEGGPILVTVLGALTTGLLGAELVMIDNGAPYILGATVLIIVVAVAVAIVVPESDRGRLLALRLGTTAALFAVNQISTRFWPSGERAWADLLLLVIGVLAVGTFLLGARAARSRGAD